MFTYMFLSAVAFAAAFAVGASCYGVGYWRFIAASLGRLRHGPTVTSWLALRVVRKVKRSNVWQQQLAGLTAGTLHATIVVHPALVAQMRGSLAQIQALVDELVVPLASTAWRLPRVKLNVRGAEHLAATQILVNVSRCALDSSQAEARTVKAKKPIRQGPVIAVDYEHSEAPTVLQPEPRSAEQATTRIIKVSGVEHGDHLYGCYVNEGVVEVGRSSSCQLRFADLRVPRRAFRLDVRRDGVWGETISRQLILNDRPLAGRERLGDGDVLKGGPESYLRLEMAGRPPS
jgi:hypothetical protein